MKKTTIRVLAGGLLSLFVAALAMVSGDSVADAGHGRPLDHFKCYVPDAPNSVVDIPDTAIQLQDQFDPNLHNATALDIQLFCNPTKKALASGATTPISDPRAHLTWYRLDQGTTVTREVLIQNQFGQQTLTLPSGFVIRLAVPTKKNQHKFPADLDHFECYLAQGDVLNIPVGLTDEFFSENVNVFRAQFFCNPVRKVHAGATFGVQHLEEHLACYFFNPTVDFSKTVRIRNQFNPRLKLPVTQGQYLCVPTQKLAWRVVVP